MPSVPRSDIQLFSCGHVIPKHQLLPMIISSGKYGLEYNLSYENRTKQEMLKNIGLGLLSLSKVIPHGIVIFFGSYSFMETVVEYWKKSGIYEDLVKVKELFSEPVLSSDTESVLSKYTAAIKDVNGERRGGAILFAVVGGKLSEGINFSDDLARGVFMVGIPFPNIKSPELVEKMKYMDLKA
jgi:chromosome transmission fidelity protein 1